MYKIFLYQVQLKAQLLFFSNPENVGTESV